MENTKNVQFEEVNNKSIKNIFFQNPIRISESLAKNYEILRQIQGTINFSKYYRAPYTKMEDYNIECHNLRKAGLDEATRIYLARDTEEIVKMETCNAPKDMVIEMNNLANAVQNLAKVNAYIMARSILDMSVCISKSIMNISDEMERKNKLDELYMLINKIEEYEDKLIELGCLKEAYDTMKLIQYPIIKLDIYEMCLIQLLPEALLMRVINKTRETWRNPINILLEIFSTYDWYWNIDNNRMLLAVGNKPISDMVYIGMPKGMIEYDAEDFHKDGIVILGEFQRFGDKYFHNKEHETICAIKIKDCFKLKMAQELIEYMLKEIAVNKLQFEDSYYSVYNNMQSINRDIQLANLRNLYIGLRNAVRECKIKKALGESIES